MKDIEDIIIAHLHDEASTDEVRRLFEWIYKDPENAKEFARYALLHAQLRGQFCGEQRAREYNEFTTGASKMPNAEDSRPSLCKRRLRSRFAYGMAGSIAASLLVALVFVLLRNDTDEPIVRRSENQEAFATIAQTVDVEWGGGSDRNRGDRVAAEVIDLLAGFVRLRLDSGVQVTLQGPAKLELITTDHAKLSSGLLTATVLGEGKGFRVDTPNAKVVDLGTAFGIHLDDTGACNVTVFDGEVDVALRDSTDNLLLKEGESIRIETGHDFETVEFDSAPFEKLWPISSGIERSTGAFRFIPPWPRRIRFVRSDDEIFIAPEGNVTTLSESLKINISSPGEYVRTEDLTPSEIPAGQAVRSFILHYHPEHDGDRRRFGRATGNITFDRPVLGLIVLHKELAASADRFPGRRAGESFEHRQLELTGNRVGDAISLSDDRHTVSLDLAAPGRFSDLVRVIVDASLEPLAGGD